MRKYEGIVAVRKLREKLSERERERQVRKNLRHKCDLNK